MSTGAGSWMEAAAATLTERLSLRPAPPVLGSAEGTYRGAPAHLEVRAFAGAHVRYARAVTVLGEGLEIHNLLVVPEAAVSAPLLGVDVVDLGKPELIVVADASVPPQAAAAGVTASSFPPAGALPSWCDRFFSRTPVFTRVPRAQFVAVAAELDQRVALTCGQLSRAAPHPDPACHAAWQQAYLDAHRTEDRGLQLLAKIFGERWSKTFLEEVLFPVRCPGG